MKDIHTLYRSLLHPGTPFLSIEKKKKKTPIEPKFPFPCVMDIHVVHSTWAQNVYKPI